jgi:transcriptional regulator with XRE-family HTH domain
MIASKEARRAEPDEWCRMFRHQLVVMRSALGMTEQEAADAFRVTLRTYRRWENGEEPRNSTSKIVDFCRRYRVSIDWLLAGDTSRVGDHLTKHTKGKVAILRSATPADPIVSAYEKLSPAGQQEIIEYIKMLKRQERGTEPAA